jgi:hypothetical protein
MLSSRARGQKRASESMRPPWCVRMRVGLQKICEICYYSSANEGLHKNLAWRGGRVV